MPNKNNYPYPPYYKCAGCNTIWDSKHTHDMKNHISWSKENDYCNRCLRVFAPGLIDRHFASDDTCVVPERIGMEASAGVYYLAGREPVYDYKPVSNKIDKPEKPRGKKNVNKTTK
jgi:hypothetical protein